MLKDKNTIETVYVFTNTTYILKKYELILMSVLLVFVQEPELFRHVI